MRIRNGFVTNSSSTNFIIISKEKLTPEYLCDKFGVYKESSIYKEVLSMCEIILSSADNDLRWSNHNANEYQQILEAFGEDTARRYQEYMNLGYKVYYGHTSDDDECFVSFFTLDSFLIDEEDFFIDGRNNLY